MNIDAILMASGLSQRFGQTDKLLAPFAGVPLAQHTLRLVCKMQAFSKVFFVCANPEVALLAKNYNCSTVCNANPEWGQRESIRLGVAASSADAYMFFTCDQPLLDEKTVEHLISKAAHNAIVVPVQAGIPGNPVLFGAKYRNELLSLTPGQHARDIKNKFCEHVRTVEVNSPHALYDVDTLDNLSYLQELFH